jgi:hypothetical protein
MPRYQSHALVPHHHLNNMCCRICLICIHPLKKWIPSTYQSGRDGKIKSVHKWRYLPLTFSMRVSTDIFWILPWEALKQKKLSHTAIVLDTIHRVLNINKISGVYYIPTCSKYADTTTPVIYWLTYKFRTLSVPISSDSSVNIATAYGLDRRGLIPSRGKRFSLLHSVQTGSGAHPASYPMGTAGPFPE